MTIGAQKWRKAIIYYYLCLSENNYVILPTIFCATMLGNDIKSTEYNIIV